MNAACRSTTFLLAVVLLATPAARAATHAVKNTNDADSGSLREALGEAKDGDSIVFDSAVHGEIALDDTLDIDTNLSIKGPGAGVLTISAKQDTVMKIAATVTVTGLTISRGETGVEIEKGKLTLIESAVRSSSGDGIEIKGGRLTLLRSLVANNHGVGVANNSGTTTCVNSTIAANSGAGIAVESGSVSTASCTIARNGCTGIDAGEASDGAEHRNRLQLTGLQRSGDVDRLQSDRRRTLRLRADRRHDEDDPRLGELASNGGATQTVAPSGGSPVIDAGDPAGCADPAGGSMLTSDQRGVRRPAGGRCDIGAVETQAVIGGTVVNRILALVDGEPITLYELKDFANGDPRLKGALVSNNAEVLDLLITKHLISKEVEKQGIVVQDADVDRYIAGIRERNQIDEDQLEAALAQQGLSRERYRNQVREELQRAQLINREIRGKVSVSQEEIERYYKEHESDAPAEGSVTISQIFLKIPADATTEQVGTVEAHANRSTASSRTALTSRTSQSASPRTVPPKPAASWARSRRARCARTLETAVAHLDAGEFSKPVRSSTGIHIVRVDERTGTVSTGTVAMPEGKADEIKSSSTPRPWRSATRAG
jgi:hypothetical protein